MDETISLHIGEAGDASPMLPPKNGNRPAFEDTQPLDRPETNDEDPFVAPLSREETESNIEDVFLMDDADIFDVTASPPSAEPFRSRDDTMFLVDTLSPLGNQLKEIDTASLAEAFGMDDTIQLDKRITMDMLAASLPREGSRLVQAEMVPQVKKEVSQKKSTTIKNGISGKTDSMPLSDTVSLGNTSIVSLREVFCRDDTWKTTPHGVFWVSNDGEFFVTHGNGSSTSFGKHEGVFWSCDPWGRLWIQDSNDTFMRLDGDGTTEEIGQCACDDWKLGLRGIHIRQNSDRFYLLEYNTGRSSLTGIFPDVHSWEVTPRGLCFQYGMVFYLLKRDGSHHKIGERVCDTWRSGFYGIFLARGRKFWFVSYTGRERFLGTFRHDEWEVGSDRLYLRYKNVLSVVIVDVDTDDQGIVRRFFGQGKRQEIGTLNTKVWLPNPEGVLYREGKQFFKIDDPTRDEPLLNWWHPYHYSVCEEESETINHHRMGETEIETLTQDSARV